jgi:hypothetical protein
MNNDQNETLVDLFKALTHNFGYILKKQFFLHPRVDSPSRGGEAYSIKRWKLRNPQRTLARTP